ncbi:hypothetical protein [Actinoplanes sp. NPDC020271]|uniref:hypothetical protein n=1 Tax=Actinoplanes sp. NPDC020271 TaxID=3363896 RepID=UPI0037A2F9A7
MAGDLLDRCCAELSGAVWTSLFSFRPTFELVARELYGRLAAQIAQLTYVELRDEAFGSTTRYWAPEQ